MKKKKYMQPGRQCWAAMRDRGRSVRKWLSNQFKKYTRKRRRNARTKTLCIYIKVEQLNAILGNNPVIHKS